MFGVLKKLFENNNINRALSLRQQLSDIKMTKSDWSIASYLMNMSKLRDQLSTIGESIEYRELIMMTLNGFPSSLELFIQSISGWSKFPKFDRLWTDFTQEDTILEARGILHGTQHEENHALTSHAKKGKGKRRKFHGRKGKVEISSPNPKQKKNKDLSHIQWFGCQKYGHYAKKCRRSKKRKHQASTADIDAYTPHKKFKEWQFWRKYEGSSKGVLLLVLSMYEPMTNLSRSCHFPW